MTAQRFSYKYRKLVSLLINTLIATLVLTPHTLLYAAEALSKPALMLANVYRSDIDLEKYWVSEKYDGLQQTSPTPPSTASCGWGGESLTPYLARYASRVPLNLNGRRFVSWHLTFPRQKAILIIV